MPIPRTSNRSISELYTYLIPFEQKARSADRIAERRDHGDADLDYQIRVIQEIFLAQAEEIEDVKKRVTELEQLLKPE